MHSKTNVQLGESLHSWSGDGDRESEWLEAAHHLSIDHQSAGRHVSRLRIDADGDGVVVPGWTRLVGRTTGGWGQLGEVVVTEHLAVLGVVRLRIASGHLDHEGTLFKADPQGMSDGG